MITKPFAMTALALLATAACLTGCAATRPTEGPVGLGRIAQVGGPRVRPDRIVEDSRCPMNARCVTAGRLVVRTTVIGGGWTRKIDLALGIPVPVADGMLTLVSATPERMAGQNPGKAAPYRFSFAFQGGL